MVPPELVDQEIHFVGQILLKDYRNRTLSYSVILLSFTLTQVRYSQYVWVSLCLNSHLTRPYVIAQTRD